MKRKIMLITLVGALLLLMDRVLVTNLYEVKADETIIKNPQIVTDTSVESGKVTVWDCIYYGSYPQTEIVGKATQSGVYGAIWEKSGEYIVDSDLYKKLENNKLWNSKNITVIDGVKYKRIQKADAISTSETSTFSKYVTAEWAPRLYYKWSDDYTYHYFRYEPIKWRVLKVNNNDIILLSDKCLDTRQFNEEADSEVDWGNCTIRSWLNGYGAKSNAMKKNYSQNNFIDDAFTNKEKQAIKTTKVLEKNYSNEAMYITSDKVYLLCEDDIFNTEKGYGFIASRAMYAINMTTRAKATTYAIAMGTSLGHYNNENADWWLRSPMGIHVQEDGYVSSYGEIMSNNSIGIRPVIQINSQTVENIEYAGKVNSLGEDKCKHRTIVKNKIKPTCFKQGYTGDKVCLLCGKIVKKGTKIKKIKLKKPSIKLKPYINKIRIKISKVKGAKKYEIKYKQNKKYIKKITSKRTVTIKKLKSNKKTIVKVRAIAVKGKKKKYSAAIKKTISTLEQPKPILINTDGWYCTTLVRKKNQSLRYVKKVTIKDNILTTYGNGHYSKKLDIIDRMKKYEVGIRKFKLSSNCKFYGTGGTGPAKIYSKTRAYDLMRRYVGLDLEIHVVNGEAVEVVIAS